MNGNPSLSAVMLDLYASSPRYFRQASLDVREGPRTEVHACCWDELGGGMVYYLEGVDPNVDKGAQRLTLKPDDTWPEMPYYFS